MQLNRETLLKAYRDMVTIRRFEERVQEEFSKGGIPGFVHLYAGAGSVRRRRLHDLGRSDYIASTHRGHGHCIAKGCDVNGMMLECSARQAGCAAARAAPCTSPISTKGMLGANGIVGGGAADGGRRGADREDAGDRQGRGGVHRRRRVQPGHDVRGDEHGRGAGSCRRSSCSRTTATANTPARPTAVGSRESPAAPRASACRRRGSTASTSSPCTRRRARRSNAPAPAAARARSRSIRCRFFGHLRGDPQLYRAKDEVGRCATSATA